MGTSIGWVARGFASLPRILPTAWGPVRGRFPPPAPRRGCEGKRETEGRDGGLHRLGAPRARFASADSFGRLGPVRGRSPSLFLNFFLL